MRQEFGTYVDPAIAALILEGAVPGDGFEVEVSMLFCDVRGFTTYAETMPAADVVATLNAIFAEIVSVVEAWGGHVDKFVGDGIDWAHFDTYAWRPTPKPGRPKGGEAYGLRASWHMLKARFGA